jgi:hypothetical protein
MIRRLVLPCATLLVAISTFSLVRALRKPHAPSDKEAALTARSPSSSGSTANRQNAYAAGSHPSPFAPAPLRRALTRPLSPYEEIVLGNPAAFHTMHQPLKAALAATQDRATPCFHDVPLVG